MSGGKHHSTRRGFLVSAGATLGGAALGYGNKEHLLELTATLAPRATPSPVPTLAAAVDTILVNGRVVTMDATDTISQAVAISGGKIQQTGTNEAIRALADANTKIIDLRGHTVTPGFVDAHNHLTVLGLIGTAYIDINPPGVSTIAELQAKIAEGCSQTPEGEWVIGQGFVSFDGHFPDKLDLDPVSPSHLVQLINQGGHMGAVNSNALRLAGVTASTPDPKYGIIVRDANGEPTGVLINHAAMDIFRRLWADKYNTLEVLEPTVTSPQAKMVSVGVTSFGDVNARGMTRMEAYFNVARRGQMTIRGYILNTIEYYNELAGRPEAIQAIRYEDDYLRFGGFKFLVDGAAVAAYTHEPHNGVSWDVATWDPNQLKDAVSTLHAQGYQCAFHVGGDAAVDMALDAIENAMNKTPRSNPRHRLEHALLNTDSALKRTRDLGVVVSAQPHMIRLLGDYLIETWGNDRAMRMIPTRTWLEMGVPLSLSSDVPTLPWWKPQNVLAAALTRSSASLTVIGQDQRLTIKEAMRAYTMGGAYAIFEDHLKGSLEPGKFADLVVWTSDPYSLAPRDLFDSTIDLTMVGGKIVYEKT